MSVSVSTQHARALRSFVLEALTHDRNDQPIVPAPFTAQTVQWSDKDEPGLGDRYALLRQVSFVGEAQTERLREPSATPNRVRIVERDLCEWTVSVQVVVRQSEREKAHATGAAALAERVRMRFWGRMAKPLVRIGLGPLRVGGVVTPPSQRGASQWESRAVLDLTYSTAPMVFEEPYRITEVSGQGTIQSTPPLPPMDYDTEGNDP